MQVFQATGFVYLIISIVCGILMLFIAIAKFKENPMLPPIVAAHAFWAGKIQHLAMMITSWHM